MRRARRLVLVVLRLPHLVLADVGDDDGLAFGGAPQVVDDVGGVEVAEIGKVLDVANGGVALQDVDGVNPGGVFARSDLRQEGFQNLAQIADEGDVGLDVLVDLSRIDFDVDLLCVGRVAGEDAGNAVIESHAAGDEQVGLLDGLVDPGFAVHAHHAERELVRGREGAEAEQRGGNRNLQALGQGAELIHGIGFQDAVAGEDDGTLGREDELEGSVMASCSAESMGCGRCGEGAAAAKSKSAIPCCASLVMSTRTGPGRPELGDQEGFANHRGDILRAGDDVVVLGDGQGDAGDINFLEGIGAEQLGGDLAGDADHGHGVHHGGGDAGDEVGGAGAGGGDGDADLRRRRGHIRRPCGRRPARGAPGCGESGYLRSAS